MLYIFQWLCSFPNRLYECLENLLSTSILTAKSILLKRSFLLYNMLTACRSKLESSFHFIIIILIIFTVWNWQFLFSTFCLLCLPDRKASPGSRGAPLTFTCSHVHFSASDGLICVRVSVYVSKTGSRFHRGGLVVSYAWLGSQSDYRPLPTVEEI